jgi:hypothetical protein
MTNQQKILSFLSRKTPAFKQGIQGLLKYTPAGRGEAGAEIPTMVGSMKRQKFSERRSLRL